MFLPVLGDIGGNMGLFLGCSLLSLFEFVDLLWDILDSRTNRSKSIPEEQPDNGSAWNNRRKSSNQQFFRICERWTSKKPLYSLRFPSIRNWVWEKFSGQSQSWKCISWPSFWTSFAKTKTLFFSARFVWAAHGQYERRLINSPWNSPSF